MKAFELRLTCQMGINDSDEMLHSLHLIIAIIKAYVQKSVVLHNLCT